VSMLCMQGRGILGVAGGSEGGLLPWVLLAITRERWSILDKKKIAESS
jgi:hypothetical protein